MKTIWCLFSIANDYSQPNNNLVAWWSTIPTNEQLQKALSCNLDFTNLINGHQQRIGGFDCRLEVIEEGVSLN